MGTDIAASTLITTWREAEFFAANHMRAMGFTDAEVTQLGADGGVDVTSIAAIAQVKHFTGSAVGAPVVQQLIGAAKGKEHAIFYALNGFTSAAISLAEETRTALFTYSLAGVVEAVSTAGNTLMDRGFVMYDVRIQTAARMKFNADLQEYGQSVINQSAAVVTATGVKAKEAEATVAGMDPTQFAEFRDNWQAAFSEMRMLRTLIVDIGGDRKRKVAEFLTAVQKIEAIAFQLSSRLGVDYDELPAVPSDPA